MTIVDLAATAGSDAERILRWARTILEDTRGAVPGR
jgi:hypothetical protein